MDSDKGLAQTKPTPRVTRRIKVREEASAFFRAGYRKLLQTVMYAGADLHEADEAIATTIKEMLPRWDAIDDHVAFARRAAISNFLKEKTRNLDRIRRRQVEKRAGTAESREDPGMTVWEDREWVLQMLNSLSPGQRDVMAYIVDGFTPTEIATLLGRSPDAIRQSLKEARARLMEARQREWAAERAPLPHHNPARKEGR
ncbi:sigma-70 family RNA polymerase sigma factor [Micromonospora sp. STR1_7]|uniref:Sigma-70 family RNA polymerase sigma factor n=1 Tax=Micromonospora parastrephiae TaxID=2806101 RepID=A0ABS1XVL0_9ACTN|nr:sigma-70 family RNA polymerase sigma factor [Micromonospora parastrephiae]MBM0233184.1 sigma-70 family RNA polymerase sigma factor [Micromonospora parastrephiae]